MRGVIPTEFVCEMVYRTPIYTPVPRIDLMKDKKYSTQAKTNEDIDENADNEIKIQVNFTWIFYSIKLAMYFTAQFAFPASIRRREFLIKFLNFLTTETCLPAKFSPERRK